jgi:hypothetical protein
MNLNLKDLVESLSILLASFIIGTLVHELTHVYQAWKSPYIKISGVDFSGFPISFGWRLEWGHKLDLSTMSLAIAESANWERDAYTLQIMGMFASLLIIIWWRYWRDH